MFVRKNRNRSGSVSVQIIEKTDGKYKVFRTVGCAGDPDEIAKLEIRAMEIIEQPVPGQQRLFAYRDESALAIENFLQRLGNSGIHVIGPELVFGTLFDRIGFNAIPDELFRHMVIARLAYPTSKLKTADYLYRYRGETVSADQLYRSLDYLHSRHKEEAERIAYEYTKKTLKSISVVFYDMTTLYFESEDEDDLRKIGFSKDGKFQCPQIMLGLLVGEEGYPIGYDIFEGNKFEGHTLIPVIERLQKKYGFPKPVVIADSGLLSKKNLDSLKEKKYEFILGARIKNETEDRQKEILKKTKGLKHGGHVVLVKSDGTKLIVSYSEKRAKKDSDNRKKGLKKLRGRITSGKLTKEQINNRGYNKFLTLENEIRVSLDKVKIAEDRKWDGLKGYVTNSSLTAEKVMENYKHLWQIEKAFRISKTDLRIRPIHHYKKRRIEAHLCIAFAAYTIYKELERLLKKNNAGFSPGRAGELTQTMYEIECVLPGEAIPSKLRLKMDPEQQRLYNILYPA